MMADMISLVTLLAVLMLGLILWYYNSKQADALQGMAKTTEEMYMTQLKLRRDERKKQPFTMEAARWLEQQAGSGIALVDVISQSQNPMWINIRAAGGLRLVVSPLDEADLRKALKETEKRSKVNTAFEPLLGDSKKNLSVTQRSLQDEEWFDLDADAVGKQLNMNWGEVSRLWFYVVQPKGK